MKSVEVRNTIRLRWRQLRSRPHFSPGCPLVPLQPPQPPRLLQVAVTRLLAVMKAPCSPCKPSALTPTHFLPRNRCPREASLSGAHLGDLLALVAEGGCGEVCLSSSAGGFRPLLVAASPESSWTLGGRPPRTRFRVSSVNS